jgi:beta-galactosidase
MLITKHKIYKMLILWISIFTCSNILLAQAPKAKTFFEPPNLMRIGVYYYPEQWPESQWERDLANIKKLGFEFTHFSDFAWTYLQPQEGVYDFAWLDKAISIAEKQGLKIILCTPTAAAPVWLGEKYPEIYLVDENGVRRKYGNRADHSIANSIYQKYAFGMAAALAKKYGNHSAIMGWQIDNEPNAFADYSESSKIAFQKWLEQKYVHIDSLNKAWVGSFWSTRYNSFDQIIIPNTKIYTEDKLSPHAVLDFKRFTAQTTADFINQQADTLRKYISANQFVTTNYTNVGYDVDPRLTHQLDFPSFTMYPVNGSNLWGTTFRTGAPYRLVEANDYYRSIAKTTGIMELQPGQVNWASTNPQPLPGAIHMWLMQAFGGGNAFVCTYRYRHPLGSSEMYHEGIVGTDGITLSQGGKEFLQAINDIKNLRKQYRHENAMPSVLQKRKTAFLWSHENLWDLENQKQAANWNTWSLRNNYTAGVKSTAAPMDFIGETDEFSAYPFIVAPAYALVSESLVTKWTDYVKNGGHLILSCRSGQKNKAGQFFEASLGGPIQNLIGASIAYNDMLVAPEKGWIKMGTQKFEWDIWSEILNPFPGTETLAVYDNQFYTGKSAVITRKLGKGSVTYIGVVSNDGELEKQIIRKIYQKANVAIENLPKGVFVEWRDGFYVAVNYAQPVVQIPLPPNSKILVGTQPLQQGQALVWK